LKRFVSIPSPIPNTNFDISYGVVTFFSIVFGPICGGLAAFIGHMLTDLTAGWGVWWSWVIGSGVYGLLVGLFNVDVKNGKITSKGWITLVVAVLVANLVAWPLVSAAGDVFIYQDTWQNVIPQLSLAFVSNSITSLVVGGILLFAYTKTQVGKNTLD
jgi:Predicted membrane protein